MTLALAIDLALGDPRWLPHPVRWIGRSIDALEIVFDRAMGRTYLSGVLFTAVIVGGTYLLTWLTLALFATINLWLAAAVEIALLYTTLAARDLDLESRLVYEALERNDLPAARRNLSQIVGRDTVQLAEREIVRATVETVAENTVDGVVTPLVFALLGGAPAAMAFKAASTLDSMVGHRDERYLRFGWASARLDDVANYIPARLSRFLFPLAAALCGLNAKQSWRIAWRDGHKSPSPNAGIAEAAAAGALNVELGGVNYYDGVASERPPIGDPLASLTRSNIPQTIRLMYAVTALTLAFGLTIRMLAWRAW